MPKSNGDLGALILGGLFGYAMATQKTAGWDDAIKKFDERLNHLRYFKAPYPAEFLAKNPNCSILLREGINCYLLGLPNASVPMIVRVLELVLKQKYKEVPEKWHLSDLIEWAERYLKNKTQLAHAFRILRNLIHTDELVTEQTCLDAIRYVSSLISELNTSASTNLPTTCSFCGRNGTAFLQQDACYIGNSIALQCSGCSRIYNL